jgi:hypothetical protein
MDESKNISTELDEAFSTLDLVNTNDIDVFLKVIMSVDEKMAQNIRGELNHVVAKYIDSDPNLKRNLKNNYYSNFNINYLSKNYHKVRDRQIYVKNVWLGNSIKDYLLGSDNVFNAFNTIKNMFNIMDDKLVYIHNILHDLTMLMDPKFDGEGKMFDHIYINTISTGEVLTGIKFRFLTLRSNKTYGEIRIAAVIKMDNFSDEKIREVISYFSYCFTCGDGRDAECICKPTSLDLQYNLEKTIRHARSCQI